MFEKTPILCGFIAVIIQIIVGKCRYGKWPSSLESLVVTFMSGAIFPTGVIFFIYSLLEVPKIDITQYKTYLAIAGIVMIYISIHSIIKECMRE